MTYPSTPERIAGSVYGLALGDAWGNRTEFWRYEDIVKSFGLRGPDLPQLAKITDDTQMSLYALRALEEWHAADPLYPLSEEDFVRLGTLFGKHFIEWSHDPDNDRAPGQTCMGSLAALERAGLDQFYNTTARESKGCGANMRAPWIGLDFRIPDSEVSEVAMLQAFVTHGHPTAVVAAAVTARLTRVIAQGKVLPGDFTSAAFDIAETHGEVGRETAEVLDRALSQLDAGVDRWNSDPCYYIGQGWVAEEALAVATYIADSMAQDDPVETLRRGAATNGDSDSIACLAGAFLGATGVQWDVELIDRLEPRYQEELAAGVRYLTGSLLL